MRKLDILILKSFFAPFFLTTVVATFILVVQYMLKYFDDFVGKDLGFFVFGELIFYFSLNMLQVALPLGVLVSSLMTFGNLGEHFELTAIKSAGISLVRALQPVFITVLILSFGAFVFNDHIVPAANLKAFSLLYDIKNTKPALDIKQGMFYDGIPNYSIKAAKKLNDNVTMMDVIIYDHSKRDGNKRVILADSSKMYTIFNDKYLKLELFNGNYYYETDKTGTDIADLTRTSFGKLDMVFSLSSFDLQRTKEELFQNNRQMKNIKQLSVDIDSLSEERERIKANVYLGGTTYMMNTFKSLDLIQPIEKVEVDTMQQQASMFSFITSFQNPTGVLKKLTVVDSNSVEIDSIIMERRNININRLREDSILKSRKLEVLTLDDLNARFAGDTEKSQILKYALNMSRNFKVNINGIVLRIENVEIDRARYVIEKHKKYSQAFACIVMFLIGAPLGAIIKKGGLGVPVIISIFFFLSYYVLSEIFQKSAKAVIIDGQLAVWLSNFILLPFGLFFLRQARIDARLFDTDIYAIWWDKLIQTLEKYKLIKNK